VGDFINKDIFKYEFQINRFKESYPSIGVARINANMGIANLLKSLG